MTITASSHTLARVAFQGIQGSHSDTAAKGLFTTSKHFKTTIASIDTVGFDSLSEVCRAVKTGLVDYAMLPLENSSTGTFVVNYELLNEFGLHIVGEYCTKETQCLIALPGTQLCDITEIRSHPYAIEQCRKFLSTMDKHVAIVQAVSTAASAKAIKDNNLTTTAAIASREAAAIYNLQVLSDSIQDDKISITRYILVAAELKVAERHLEPKTSLQFTLKNTVGAFYKALACFSLRDINISKVESRPSNRSITLGNPWEYTMYLDIDGSINDNKVRLALEHLKEFANVKIIGSYPRYQPVAESLSSPYGISM